MPHPFNYIKGDDYMGKDLKGRELGTGIRQKANGRYEARAMVKGHSISISNESLRVLRKEFDIAKQKLESEQEVFYGLTLNEWFDQWFYNYKIHTIKKTSITPIKQKYRKVGDILGERQLDKIKNFELQEIITSLINKGHSSKYVKEIASTICSIFAMAKENDLIKTNPAAMLAVPNVVHKKDYRILEPDEEQVFLSYAKRRWSYELIFILLNMGLRCGEIGGLNIDDVDFNNKSICVNKQLVCSYYEGVKTLEITSPKTANAIRELPFTNAEVERVLKHQIEKTINRKKELGNRWRGENEFLNLLFTTNLGSPMTRYNIEREINHIINEMNTDEQIMARMENREPKVYQNCYPHALRHTFCSKCFKVGVDPKVVQMLVGHQNYSTTIDIYTHVMQDVLNKEMNKLKQAEVSKLNIL